VPSVTRLQFARFAREAKGPNRSEYESEASRKGHASCFGGKSFCCARAFVAATLPTISEAAQLQVLLQPRGHARSPCFASQAAAESESIAATVQDSLEQYHSRLAQRVVRLDD